MAAVSTVCCSCSSSSIRYTRATLPSPLVAPASSSSASFGGVEAVISKTSFGGVEAVISKTSASPSSSSSVIGRRDERRFTFSVNANVGEWGARDPFPAELESNFGDKVIANQGTEHIILIPPSLLGLSERNCTPLPPGTVPLSEEEATALLRKVIGWRLAKTDNGLKMWTEWKLKDSEAAIALFNRIAAVVEAGEHYPELHVQGLNVGRAELSTQSIGGLSMNDFIVAAKIDKIKTSDLVKKNKFWA